MQTVFIQVKCDLGKSYVVAVQAIDVEGVSEVYSTSSHYDLMMKCYLQDDVDIGHFVNESIQVLPGVRDTFTIITFKAFG